MNEVKTVLVADDDPGMQDAFAMIFERAGYNTIVIDSGDPILDEIAPIPDIYVLDRQLSGVDGTDVCRFLKDQSRTAQIPVIIVSASPRASQLAKDACADAFLEKPFDQRKLLNLVASFLTAKTV